MNEITDNSNRVDSSPKKRRIYILFLLLGIVGGLVLYAAIAFWYFKRVDVPPPKMPQPTGVLSFAATCVVGMAAREARTLAFSGSNGRSRWAGCSFTSWIPTTSRTFRLTEVLPASFTGVGRNCDSNKN